MSVGKEMLNLCRVLAYSLVHLCVTNIYRTIKIFIPLVLWSFQLPLDYYPSRILIILHILMLVSFMQGIPVFICSLKIVPFISNTVFIAGAFNMSGIECYLSGINITTPTSY